ncbi:MAG: Gfo/Idh/MocA family protein [Gemmataceae bacterium]
MAKTFRIGVLGLTHDHVWSNLRELRETGRSVLVAAADPNAPLLDKVRQEYGCAVHTQSEKLLDVEQLDAVYLFSDNASSVRWTELAAAKGLHILVEKPMAHNLAGADRMLAAVRQANVRLMVNWPFAWWPQLRRALEMAEGGTIGNLWQVKYRAAHAGPRELGCSPYFYGWLYDRARNGAGALMDYCCYGAVLARCLLGMPSRVTGVAGRLCKEDILVEDNAVLLFSYPRALALSEGSWTQIDKKTAYITTIYGTKGTLFIEPRQGGRLLLATADQPDGVEVEVAAPPPALRSASAHFLHCLESGEPFLPLCDARMCRDAQEMLEAGLLSAAQGREIALPLKSFAEPSR